MPKNFRLLKKNQSSSAQSAENFKNSMSFKSVTKHYRLISDIIVNNYTTKIILKSQYIFKNFILFIFN